MHLKTKTPLIQSIVPNVQDYITNVQQFYNDKIELIMYKINQFIAITCQLTEIQQQLIIQGKKYKSSSKQTHQERQIQQIMTQDQIQKFLDLKNEAIEYQTGNKYLFPQLPKIQRNLNQRKYSKQDSMSSDSDKYETDSKQSINQICNLLGTLDLQSKTNEQLCESIQNIVASMNQLSINEENEQDNPITTQILSDKSNFAILNHFDSKTIQFQRVRKVKKAELQNFERNLFSNSQLLSGDKLKKFCQQKLSQIKQLFKSHLEKSVSEVISGIQQILSKALKDIRQYEKAYVPLHKISTNFNKLNMKFYRSEGVIQCLHKYLKKRVNQCCTDSHQTYVKNGKQISIKTNYKLRFFKHILLKSIFIQWIQGAVVDMHKMVNEKLDEKKLGSSRKIECEKQTETAFQTSQTQNQDILLLQRNGHSFYDFIM